MTHKACISKQAEDLLMDDLFENKVKNDVHDITILSGGLY